MHPHEVFMREAIAIAQRARSAGEYAIGAVVIVNGEIVGAAHPALSMDKEPDPTAHAEVCALRAAALRLSSRHLEEAILYSTLEPCPMCTSAAIWAKCSAIVFGATQEDALAASQRPNAYRTFRQIPIKASYVAERGTPSLRIVGNFLRSECLELLV